MTTSKTYKHLIIGGGNSAGYAVHQFVEHGLKPSELCIISSESYLPYERPALSKAFLFKPPSSPVRLPGFHTCVAKGWDRQDASYYKSHGIDTKLGSSVTKFNAKERKAVLEDGSEYVGSESVILATGARVVRLDMLPGEGLDGVFYLRGYEDGLKLYEVLHKEGKKGKVVVIGGGYIGMEVAGACGVIGGWDISMVYPEESIMPRLFTKEIAKFYEEYYKKKGVKLLCGGRVCKEFVGDGKGKVKGVRICKDDQEEVVDADVVVVGVGARPNVELFDGQVDFHEKDGRKNGVKVDENFKTSADGVYAIGDIAAFPYQDGYTRVEHVSHCRASALHAVDSIMKGSEKTGKFKHVPYFYSRVFDLSWQFFGGSEGEETFTVGDFNPKLLAGWVDKDNTLTGIFMEHPSPEDTATMEKICDQKPKIDVGKVKECDSADSALKMIKSAMTAAV